MEARIVSKSTFRRRTQRDLERTLQEIRDSSNRLVYLVQSLDEQEDGFVVPESRYSNSSTHWPPYKNDDKISRDHNWSAWQVLDSYHAEEVAGTQRPKRKRKAIHCLGDTDSESDQDLHESNQTNSTRCSRKSSTKVSTPCQPFREAEPSLSQPPVSSPQAHCPSPRLCPLSPPRHSSSWTSQTEFFRPSFKVGLSGEDEIPCSAGEFYLLSMTEDMKRQLDNVQHQLTQLTDVVNNLSGGKTVDDQCSTEEPEDIQFPLGSLEQVEHLEDWLKNKDNSSKKNNLIYALSAIGGQDVKHVTWNILSHVFSDCVAKKICWKGVNGKMAFSQMVSKTMITRAVRQCHVAKEATEMEINKHVIRWFNLANDRGGGRRNRELSRSTEHNQWQPDD
ncbi:uncharacterized protein LOC144039919 isoform X2 [Vanacampus margaritifer]